MADEGYLSLPPRGGSVTQPQPGKSRLVQEVSSARNYGVVGTALGAIALVLGLTALIVALWKWYYWSKVAGADAINTKNNVIVDGWINSLTFYLLYGFNAIRRDLVPLLPEPDVAMIYGNLATPVDLQEADLYHITRTTDVTTQPNNLFIDTYVQQIDSTDGTIGLNFVTMNSFFFISDATLKTNISVLNGTQALQLVRRINASSFIWSGDDEDEIQYGFIAQNVNDSFPAAVKEVGANGGGFNETVAINAVALLSQLWAAVQQLDKQVNP